MKLQLFIASSILLSLLSGCGENKSDGKSDEGVKATEAVEETVEVETVPLVRTTFHHELISNGKLSTHYMTDLYFQSAEIITDIRVKNGDRVNKGDRIASLDLFRLKNKREQAYDAYERSKLELKDVLIGQGYGATDTSQIPPAVFELAKVKSGYTNARIQYDLARFEEECGVLVAPFSGTVANLTAKQFNKANTGEPFCRIIDSDNMEVDFTVLESELPLITLGDQIQITPYTDPSVNVVGKIATINPIVETNGMVKVKASVQRDRHLYEGGNVRINVRRSVPNKWVVPKSAVVMRSSKQVLFTYKEGKAMWNYVQTELENATQYVVLGETLQENDVVITSNNINLAHETPVKLRNE